MIRLLIIEKHLAVRLALQIRLQSSPNIEVIASVESLTDAEMILNVGQPDVVLIGLAGGKARFMGSTIAAISSLVAQNIRVIVLTSYIDAMEHEMIMAAGAGCYLLKQIDSKSLIAEIESLVEPASP